MSEFLIVLTQYLRLMLSVDITELCLKLHPLGPESHVPGNCCQCEH